MDAKSLFLHLITTLLLFLAVNAAYGQKTTFNNDWTYGEDVKARVTSIEIFPKDCIAYVTLEIQAIKKTKQIDVDYDHLAIFSVSSAMHHLGSIYDGKRYGFFQTPKRVTIKKPKVGESQFVKLVFSGSPDAPIKPGANKASLSGPGFFTFSGYTINNPMHYTTELHTLNSLKSLIDENKDEICGIYEEVGGTERHLALVKMDKWYRLIFIKWKGSQTTYDYAWKTGDICAFDFKQTNSDILKCTWVMPDQNYPSEAYLSIDYEGMVINEGGRDYAFLKTYPITSSTSSNKTNITKSTTPPTRFWTGSGFALRNGYIITNHHVIDGAKQIIVQGVNGTSTEYKAKVIASDKKNDIALVRIEDCRFKGFNNVPYSISNRVCDVGEDIFVLGYPLTSYMGEEMKLTNGIISSRSGYQGDLSTYQISAPVQPGNSCGPMFDSKGNIVGIVNAGIPGADNVGYAIKTSYLFNLINSTSSSSEIIPQTSTVNATDLAGKVKQVRNCVFYIKCAGD